MNKSHQEDDEETMGQEMERKYKNDESIMTHHQKKRGQDKVKILQRDI